MFLFCFDNVRNMSLTSESERVEQIWMGGADTRAVWRVADNLEKKRQESVFFNM